MNCKSQTQRLVIGMLWTSDSANMSLTGIGIVVLRMQVKMLKLRSVSTSSIRRARTQSLLLISSQCCRTTYHSHQPTKMYKNSWQSVIRMDQARLTYKTSSRSTSTMITDENQCPKNLHNCSTLRPHPFQFFVLHHFISLHQKTPSQLLRINPSHRKSNQQ